MEAASNRRIDYREIQKNISKIIEHVKKGQVGNLQEDLETLENDIRELHKQIFLVIPQTPPPKCSAGTIAACADTSVFEPKLAGFSNPPAPPDF